MDQVFNRNEFAEIWHKTCIDFVEKQEKTENSAVNLAYFTTGGAKGTLAVLEEYHKRLTEYIQKNFKQNELKQSSPEEVK